MAIVNREPEAIASVLPKSPRHYPPKPSRSRRYRLFANARIPRPVTSPNPPKSSSFSTIPSLRKSLAFRGQLPRQIQRVIAPLLSTEMEATNESFGRCHASGCICQRFATQSLEWNPLCACDHHRNVHQHERSHQPASAPGATAPPLVARRAPAQAILPPIPPRNGPNPNSRNATNQPADPAPSSSSQQAALNEIRSPGARRRRGGGMRAPAGRHMAMEAVVRNENAIPFRLSILRGRELPGVTRPGSANFLRLQSRGLVEIPFFLTQDMTPLEIRAAVMSRIRGISQELGDWMEGYKPWARKGRYDVIPHVLAHGRVEDIDSIRDCVGSGANGRQAALGGIFHIGPGVSSLPWDLIHGLPQVPSAHAGAIRRAWNGWEEEINDVRALDAEDAYGDSLDMGRLASHSPPPPPAPPTAGAQSASSPGRRGRWRYRTPMADHPPPQWADNPPPTRSPPPARGARPRADFRSASPPRAPMIEESMRAWGRAPIGVIPPSPRAPTQESFGAWGPAPDGRSTPLPRTPSPGTPFPGTPSPRARTQESFGARRRAPDRRSTPLPRTPSPGTPFPGTPSHGTPFPGTPSPGTPFPGTPSPGARIPSGPSHQPVDQPAVDPAASSTLMDAIQEMVVAGLGLSNRPRLHLSFGPDRGLWISEMVAQVLDVEYPVSRTALALPRVTCDHDSYSTGCDAGGILRAFLTEWMELFITARCVPGGGGCAPPINTACHWIRGPQPSLLLRLLVTPSKCSGRSRPSAVS